MRYLLDTNVCVMYLNGRSVLVRDRLHSTLMAEMAVCSIVKAELFYGAMRSNNPTRALERQQNFLKNFASLPFDDEAAIICGQIRARLASTGTPIGACDVLIAAIALSNNLTLVTHNTREFKRVEGLQVEDWER
ncbi:MAG: type II toxin-antitoxin system VapC family toxin [Leptolyngbyaceae cyanobacterium SM1_4_3]|nr:type II toxin-antitoxin system VapC family toxin [Leptolyngbyaceae cyanobacterium SM1_4_3]NJN90975.1 type II toxin-antitoxin system VapC family toxin [Leptolyngbyaceae cyanobacterium SL_5_14]NJO66552.1 type II toxin-antitoxin system VapC family toxin [Leptolyngbyaceae cyanobacterium RM1_405_57]